MTLMFLTYSHRLRVLGSELIIEAYWNHCWIGKLSIYVTLGMLLRTHNHKEYNMNMATYSTLSAQLIKYFNIEKQNI